MKNRAIDIVFDNKHIDKADTPSGKDGFMQSLEDNILEPRIYAQLEFSRAVRDKIDSRNEVNTNISVLDQKIEEQKKQNELEQLKTEQALIASRGLTREIL